MLALLHLRATLPAQRPHWVVGATHGIAGAAGLILLLVALRGPPRGGATGSSSFGLEAAVLLAAALLAGLAIVVLVRQRARERTVTGAMVVHACSRSPAMCFGWPTRRSIEVARQRGGAPDWGYFAAGSGSGLGDSERR